VTTVSNHFIASIVLYVSYHFQLISQVKLEGNGTCLYMVYTDDINERKPKYFKENSMETGLDPLPRKRKFVHVHISSEECRTKSLLKAT